MAHQSPRHARQLRLAAAVAAAALTTAACGSSGGSDSSSGDTAQADAAKAAVAQAAKTPTSITVDEPLKSQPTGGTVVYLECELVPCQLVSEGMKAAAEAAGLSYKTITISAHDPATLISGMKQALAMKPLAVSFSGYPEAVWKNEEPEFKAAGVPIIPTGAGGVAQTPVTPAGTLVGDADSKKMADAAADYFIADSDAAGKALLVDMSEIGAFQTITDEFKAHVTSACDACAVSETNVTLADLAAGKATGAIVSALQRDPDIKYVEVPLGDVTTGLKAALAAAGVNGVKVMSQTPAISNLKAVETGDEATASSMSYRVLGWMTVDAALRNAQGMTVPDNDGGLATMLLTKDNVGDPQDASVDVPTDYATQYKKLWHVG